VLRGGEEQWTDLYNTCYVIRPDRRRTRDGTWVKTKLLRPHKSVQVISSIFGRWYYLGSYQSVETLDLEPTNYAVLPEKVRYYILVSIPCRTAHTRIISQTQRGVLRFIAHGDNRKEARDMITNGEVILRRVSLHRVAFDEAVQSTLLAAGLRQLRGEESEGPFSSEDEGFE
jgi:nucleolar pre-ribosomal-associated protein 1